MFGREGADREFRAALRELVTKRDDLYAGADLRNARRMMALTLIIGVVVGVMLLVVAIPAQGVKLGALLLELAYAAFSLAAAYWLFASDKVTFRHLWVLNAALIPMLALLVWQSGGTSSPFNQAYLLALIPAAGIHPARRALPLLGLISLGILSPLLYEPYSYDKLLLLLSHMLPWYALSGAFLILMTYVRLQRIISGENEAQARRLARIDELTGLGNRRAFEEALDLELSRLERSGSTLSLLLLDVDRFKEINDTWGHPAGDECLRQVAVALASAARATDACYRWGGDEFAVILRETDHAGAQRLRDRVRKLVAASCQAPDGRPIRISCGIAQAVDSDRQALIERADVDLFRDKTGPHRLGEDTPEARRMVSEEGDGDDEKPSPAPWHYDAAHGDSGHSGPR